MPNNHGLCSIQRILKYFLSGNRNVLVGLLYIRLLFLAELMTRYMSRIILICLLATLLQRLDGIGLPRGSAKCEEPLRGDVRLVSRGSTLCGRFPGFSLVQLSQMTIVAIMRCNRSN